jgi:hypothetical protein
MFAIVVCAPEAADALRCNCFPYVPGGGSCPPGWFRDDWDMNCPADKRECCQHRPPDPVVKEEGGADVITPVDPSDLGIKKKPRSGFNPGSN